MRIKYKNEKLNCMCCGKKCYDMVYCECVNEDIGEDTYTKDIIDEWDRVDYRSVKFEF